MASKYTMDLTKGNVTKQLFTFAIPVILSNLLQHCYNIADKAVVGQFAQNGAQALAAIGATGSITALVLNMCTGLALGANVRCSNMRGARDMNNLRKSMHTAVLLSILMGVVLSVIGLLITKPILHLLGTPEEIFDLAELYLRIYFAGLLFTSIYNFCANVLRANGDTKRPMLILTVSGIVNVALNLILVVFCDMSVAGVAIATVISKVVSAVWELCILFDPKGEYKLSLKELRIHPKSLSVIVRVGVPSGINGMLFSLSNLTVQSSVNSFNDTAIIAGKAAATDVGNLLYQIINGFYTASLSFSGQCYGARDYKRIDSLVIRAGISSSAMVAIGAALCTAFPRQVIGIFNSSPEVAAAGTSVLYILCWGYVLFAVSEMFMGCSRGMGNAMGTMIMNIVGICLPRLIWVWWIFPLNRTIVWLYLCFPISWTVSSIMQGSYYIYLRRKLDKKVKISE